MAVESVLPETGCLSCGGKAEPEEEDGLTKYVCAVCGYEFGFAFTPAAAAEDCQLGIPESLRLAGRNIDIPVTELTDEGRRVFLGATIPRRPE